MKKVLLFVNYPKNQYFGGIANIISLYISHKELFAKNNFNIDYFNPNIPFSKNKLLSHIQKLFFFKKEKKKIKQFFSNNGKPDYLHIHSSRGWILYNDLKLIKHIKRKYNIKIVLSIHFAETKKIFSRTSFIKSKEINVINKFVDRTILLSKSTIKEFEQLGISNEKMSLLYTFHNRNCSKELVRKGKECKLNLIFVGSLDERKGIIDLLKALKAIDNNNIGLNICGDSSNDSIKKMINEAISENGNIAFHGYVKGEKKEELFANSDILVLPSYGEGMPIVIMEALGYGCGVISTDVGAIPEIINEENGLLVKPGDIQALCDSINDLYSNRDKLFEIQKTNLEKGKKFSLDENIVSLCQIYRSLENV